MWPYLFESVVAGYRLKPPTYGFFLALAFSSAYLVSLYRALRLRESPKHVENQFLLIVLGSVVGSRLFHVLFEEPSYYFRNPSKIWAIWEGGYTLYGAMLTSILALYLYGRIRKLNFLQFADIAAPATALGIGIGRVGCFLAGCCWGSKTSVPWAVVYTHPEAFTSVKGVPVHPSQLYEAAVGFFLFFLLTWRFRSRSYRGQIFLEGLTLYAVARFLIEYCRGDEYRGYVFGGLLSYSQFVSLVILPFSIAGIVHLSRGHEEPGQQNHPRP